MYVLFDHSDNTQTLLPEYGTLRRDCEVTFFSVLVRPNPKALHYLSVIRQSLRLQFRWHIEMFLGRSLKTVIR